MLRGHVLNSQFTYKFRLSGTPRGAVTRSEKLNVVEQAGSANPRCFAIDPVIGRFNHFTFSQPGPLSSPVDVMLKK